MNLPPAKYPYHSWNNKEIMSFDLPESPIHLGWLAATQLGQLHPVTNLEYLPPPEDFVVTTNQH